MLFRAAVVKYITPQFYRERTDYISAEGAQHAGMGFGPTSITFYGCAASP